MGSWIDPEVGSFKDVMEGQESKEDFGKRVDTVIDHGILVGLGRKERQEGQIGKN